MKPKLVFLLLVDFTWVLPELYYEGYLWVSSTLGGVNKLRKELRFRFVHYS